MPLNTERNSIRDSQLMHAEHRVSMCCFVGHLLTGKWMQSKTWMEKCLLVVVRNYIIMWGGASTFVVCIAWL